MQLIYIVAKTEYYGEKMSDESPLILGAYRNASEAYKTALRYYEERVKFDYIASKEDLKDFEDMRRLEVFYKEIENYNNYYVLEIIITTLN